MIQGTEVRYRVTGSFGMEDVGTIINSILIAKEKLGYDSKALLYHPHVKGECPSFEICVLGDGEVWESQKDESYVNITSGYKEFEKNLFGSKFKFRRKITVLAPPRQMNRSLGRRGTMKKYAEQARIEHLVPEVKHLGPLQRASLLRK